MAGLYELGSARGHGLSRLLNQWIRKGAGALLMPGHEGFGPVMPASSWRIGPQRLNRHSTYSARGRALRQIAVIGFSTGGTLALHLARQRPVARQVLLAPFLAIRYTGLIPLDPATYLRYVARLIPNLPRRGPAVRDPEMRLWAAAHRTRF